VALVFRDTRRLHYLRRDGGEACFFQLINSRSKGKPERPHLLQDVPIKGRYIDYEFVRRQNVSVSVLVRVNAKRNTGGLVVNPHTRCKRGCIDSVVGIDSGN
jgi:hypothetical protein